MNRALTNNVKDAARTDRRAEGSWAWIRLTSWRSSLRYALRASLRSSLSTPRIPTNRRGIAKLSAHGSTKYKTTIHVEKGMEAEIVIKR